MKRPRWSTVDKLVSELEEAIRLRHWAGITKAAKKLREALG